MIAEVASYKNKLFVVFLFLFSIIINQYYGSRGVFPIDSLLHFDNGYRLLNGDSPFSDLSVLCRELAGKINVPVPGFLVGGVLGLMRSTIKSKANFDIYNCKPIENVDKCFIPAIFTAGEEDDFISPSHAQDLHNKYTVYNISYNI